MKYSNKITRFFDEGRDLLRYVRRWTIPFQLRGCVVTEKAEGGGSGADRILRRVFSVRGRGGLNTMTSPHPSSPGYPCIPAAPAWRLDHFVSTRNTSLAPKRVFRALITFNHHKTSVYCPPGARPRFSLWEREIRGRSPNPRPGVRKRSQPINRDRECDCSLSDGCIEVEADAHCSRSRRRRGDWY
jgi:hypothetical protein